MHIYFKFKDFRYLDHRDYINMIKALDHILCKIKYDILKTEQHEDRKLFMMQALVDLGI